MKREKNETFMTTYPGKSRSRCFMASTQKCQLDKPFFEFNCALRWKKMIRTTWSVRASSLKLYPLGSFSKFSFLARTSKLMISFLLPPSISVAWLSFNFSSSILFEICRIWCIESIITARFPKQEKKKKLLFQVIQKPFFEDTPKAGIHDINLRNLQANLLLA